MVDARPILITGCRGQVGWELQRALAWLGPVVGVDLAECDFSKPQLVSELVHSVRPWAIANAAAYTAVDKAESEADLARAVNVDAPRALAHAAAEVGAVVVHYSTDYVFDGSGTTPWREEDACAPLSVYGATKREGERAVLEAGSAAVVLRTSWVYGLHGANFLKSILRAALSRPALTVVSDQIGAPTPASLLADVTALLFHAARRDALPAAPVLWHCAPTGETSWHGYASVVVDEARAAGAAVAAEEVDPIPTEQWPTPAARPRNSRLDCRAIERALGITLPHWEAEVRRVTRYLLNKELFS